MDWTSDITQLGEDSKFIAWLTKPYIISDAFNKLCKSLKVTLINQGFRQALADEYTELKQIDAAKYSPLIREVFLLGDKIPWSYGRTIIPYQTYLFLKTKIDNLQENLLGKSLLYDNPEVERSNFEFKKLESDNPITIDIKKHLSDNTLGIDHTFNELWARRSIFTINNLPLMVTDVYLPTVPNYPNETNVD